MRKYNIITIIIGVALSAVILIYPPVIKYTDGESGYSQVRRLIVLPRTYTETYITYKLKSGGKLRVLTTLLNDIDVMKELNEMESKGYISDKSAPIVVKSYIKYDISKLLLELMSVILPITGLFVLINVITNKK